MSSQRVARSVLTTLVVTTVSIGLAACGLGQDSASKEVDSPLLTGLVPKAQCQPGDKVETGLQGQVPVADRQSGRAAEGYNCNLTLVGSFESTAFATLDTLKDCAYYHTNADPVENGTFVLDVSNPTNPVQTDYLTTPAMQAAQESIRVNATRGLLVAGQVEAPGLDIYDVSGDCRHPKPLFAGTMPTALGHEGWITPDGMTYYMSNAAAQAYSGTGNPTNNVPPAKVTPIDLSDPANPQEIIPGALISHGLSTSDDGNRGYFCTLDTANGLDELVIVDLSDVQARRSGAQMRVISRTVILDNAGCQSTYPLTYGGRPYVVQYGEASTGRCVNPAFSNFSVPHIFDVADETAPKLVSTLMLEVDDPRNCPAMAADLASDASAVFTYDVHHCTPDRLHDPTILACGWFKSGLRVFDIRDPQRPKELAYYNIASGGLGAGSRPVIRTDRREIWFTDGNTGFHVVKFADGVWPFPETPPCPPVYDYFFNQYNPGLGCR